MKKIIAIIAVAVVTAGTFAGEVRANIEGNLKKAVASGDAAAAANWAAALNSLKQAELADEQKKFVRANNDVVRVYGNLVKSAPDILNALELYNSLQKHTDKELTEMLKLGRLLLKLGEGPISFNELKPIVEGIRAREIEFEREHEEWLKNHKNRK